MAKKRVRRVDLTEWAKAIADISVPVVTTLVPGSTEFDIAEIARLGAAVDYFAEQMKKRLFLKVSAGYHGWDDLTNKENIRTRLHICASVALSSLPLNKQQEFIDMANYSMFLWLFDEDVIHE